MTNPITQDASADLPIAFFEGVAAMCERLKAPNPMHPLRTWMSESGVNAKAFNPAGGASGLNQAMPATLPGMGWTRGGEEYRKLSALEQLPYVERFYSAPNLRGRLVTTAAWYVATFLPAFIAQAADPKSVLAAKGATGIRGLAYTANAVFDVNKDSTITVDELDAAIARACVGARWASIERKMRQVLGLSGPVEDLEPLALDVGTYAGIQRALLALGIYPSPGNVDGIPGPKTSASIVAFQIATGLRPDGVVGPLTRAALTKALADMTKAKAKVSK